MYHELKHPADQIVEILNRVYEKGLTTTSGGNLSVLENNGDIWITPSGIDKGTLTRDDICRVKPDGTVTGRHKPSVELPFHASVYKARPDIKAILHAHPPKLVAFSIVRKVPETNLTFNTFNFMQFLGTMTNAAYAVPGSTELGDIVSAEFQAGHNAVMMENHGIVVGGYNMRDCYLKFETLEAAAALQINANKIGKLRTINEADLPAEENVVEGYASSFGGNLSAEERAARRDIAAFIKRSYKQKLFGSASGTISMRLSDNRFLITLSGIIDRAHMDETNMMLIKNTDTFSSYDIQLHKRIYEKNPEINAIFAAEPPHAMAFAVTDAVFDPRTIPESYILLRESTKMDFKTAFNDVEKVALSFSAKTPMLICENLQVIATGNSLLQAFDRLEVCEATAKSILAAKEIGEIVHISDDEIKEIDIAFNLN